MLTVFHNPRLLIYYVEDKRIRMVSFHMLLIVSFLLDIMASTNNTSLSPEMQAQLKHFFKIQFSLSKSKITKLAFLERGDASQRYSSFSVHHWIDYKRKVFKNIFLIVFLLKNWSFIVTHSIPGDHDLNKHENTVPEDASKQVIAFLAKWFFRKGFLKKNRQIVNDS